MLKPEITREPHLETNFDKLKDIINEVFPDRRVSIVYKVNQHRAYYDFQINFPKSYQFTVNALASKIMRIYSKAHKNLDPEFEYSINAKYEV